MCDGVLYGACSMQYPSFRCFARLGLGTVQSTIFLFRWDCKRRLVYDDHDQ